MKIKSIKQAEEAEKPLCEFYDDYIRKAVKKAGSMGKLSESLKMERTAISQILKDGNYSRLKKTAKSIEAKL